MKNAIIICSGGLDSVVCAHHVKNIGYKNIIILFFNYGQKSLAAERKSSRFCASNLNANFIEMSIPELAKLSTSLINIRGKSNNLSRKDLKNTSEESKRWYVPCRNLLFISYALALADSLRIKNNTNYDIFTGFKCEGRESYPDATKEFVNKFNSLVNGLKLKSRIKTPLIEMDKEDIILLGTKLNADLKKTFSCYTSTKHCGSCLACMLRKEGFHWSGIKDKTEYKL